MNLLPKNIEESIPPLYSGEKNPDPKTVCKFFTPWSNWTWYVLEGEPEPGEDGEPVDFRFFGYVDGLDPELGYFSLRELESVRGPAGLRIERDLFYTPEPLSKVRARVEGGRS